MSNEEIGGNVEEHRQLIGTSKSHLANVLGITVNSLNSKLSGSRPFKMSEIIAIADLWNMTIDELVGRSF